jgi:phosphoglycerol transferase MdoB-like AlkP superfamily enzyme
MNYQSIINRMKMFFKGIMPVSGGICFFIIIFLYGLINNLSLSYMGNTSDYFVKFIIDNFACDIALFILKIMSAYIVLAIMFSLIIHLAVISFHRIFSITPDRKRYLILNLILTFTAVLVFFLKDIILHPQLYINNFHSKNIIFRFILDFSAAYINPCVFTVLQITFATTACGLIIMALIKYYNIIFIYTAAGSAFLSVIFLITVYSGGNKQMQDKRPNVIIIASDALRPDHLSGNGYFRDTSPNIDWLIKKGASFNNAFIEVPRTYPSWVSILTGQFSSTHGIRHMFPTSRDINRDFKTIVKSLRSAGYFTSVISDFAGDIFGRIDLGFENIDTPGFNFNHVLEQTILEKHAFLLPFLTNSAGLKLFPVLRDSAYFCPPDMIAERAIEKINNNGGKPFFITTFFSSTHFPYSPPYPYYKRYSKKEYNGPYKYQKQIILNLDKDKKESVTKDDIIQINALYDGGIRAFDDAAGKIIGYLKENSLFDNTLIIIVSDHGENLYEDNLGIGHGEHFRGRYAIKVPLIMHYPPPINSSKTINDMVRIVDIAPTIMEILGMPSPSGTEGVSLLPLIKGGKIPALTAYGETGIWFDNADREELFFQKLRIMYPDIVKLAELEFNNNRQVVLNDRYRDLINLAKHRYAYDGRYKLIYMPLKDRIIYELYDTQKDPDEKNNIAGIDTYNLARMKNILFKFIKRNGDVIIKNEFVFPGIRY